jgi:hypothetical protein
MVAWAEIRPALISLFSALAPPAQETPPFGAEWNQAARKAVSDKYRFALYLHILNVSGIGEDELRYERNETTGDVTEAVTGHRKIALRVEAHVLDESDEHSAFHVIERVRTRLRRSRSIEALDAVELSINAIGPALATSYKGSGRIVPRATMDIVLNAVANEDDPIPVGFIERVEWTSRIEDVDGVATSPPNVTNEITPPEQ